MRGALYLALCHHPVRLGDGRVGTAALTTLDAHDLARVGRTYDARASYVVTPIEAHARLCAEIRAHFVDGPGAALVRGRRDALMRLRVASGLEALVAEVTTETGERPRLALVEAEPLPPSLRPDDARAHLAAGHPLVLCFGTAQGLASEALAPLLREGDGYLPPIEPGAYNHLSVRAAFAIATDRLVGAPWPAPLEREARSESLAIRGVDSR